MNVQDCLDHVAKYEREFKKWETRAKDIIEVYRDDKYKTRKTAKFNILWSNVQTLVPATFAKLPQPDVSRRFKDNDPVGRVAGMILERALDYDIQHYPDYRATMKQCVHDRFLGGRGTAWARYEPHIAAKASGLPTDGDQVTEDIDEPQEQLDYECAPTDYVHWKDFGHSVARTWEEVTLVWRKVYMTRDACVTRFGEEGEKIPLDSRPDSDKNLMEETSDARALIIELWNKENKKAYWLSKSLGKFVDEKDDPLGLEGFFPCPKPLYATLTNETLVPVPDFTLYQDQAQALDVLCDRIDGLIRALQVKGVFNAEFTELGRLFTEGENNTLIPIKNFAAFAEKQGLQGAIDIVDLTPIFNALKAAYEAMEEQKQQIYDITGLADIVRGQSQASETATAQQIKGQYASLRLNAMKSDVAQFATDLLQLKAQIMCAKFNAETLVKISAADQLSDADKQYIQPAIALLIGEERMTNPAASPGPNPLRAFRIDVAADSLVQLAEAEEKEARTQFVTAMGAALKAAQEAYMASPELGILLLEAVKFAAAAFKAGKQFEGTLDQTIEQLKQQAAAKKQQPPPPDPEMMKVQAEQQAEQARMQMEAQQEQQRMQMEQTRAQADHAIEQARAQADMQVEQQRMTMEARFEQERQAREMQMQQMQAQMDAHLEMFKARLQAETSIEIAEIGAKATLSAAQTTAAESATKE